jgi:circadian clock protein KaiB
MPDDTMNGVPDEGPAAEALAAAFARAAAAEAETRYVLTLYVTGLRPRSQRAIENVRRLCDEHLAGRYELKIIDIYQQPALAQGAQVIAAPTLVKELPPPLRQIIGDMSDDGRVLVALGVKVPEKSRE